MQELYPLVLKCDVMLCSTGVNQSAMSTRLKTFLDRLISLDGGFFVGADQYEQKGPEWRDKCIALAARLSSTGQLHYDARMWGRVAAYFITSKDEKNSVRTVVRNFKTPLSTLNSLPSLCEMETPITGSFMLRVTGMQVRGPIRMKSFAMTSSIFPPTLNS